MSIYTKVSLIVNIAKKMIDCSHVGFAISVEQLYDHRRGGAREKRAEGGVVSDKSRF